MGAGQLVGRAVLLAMLVAPRAFAEPPSHGSAEAWPPRPVTVRAVGTEPDLEYELSLVDREDGTEQPVVHCFSRCQLELFPGRYRLSILDENGAGSARSFDLEGPSELRITPASSSNRTLGLLLGTTGIAAVLIGAVLFVGGSSEADCIDSCGTDPALYKGVGVATFLVGAIITPIGWVMFGQNLKPKVEVRPLR